MANRSKSRITEEFTEQIDNLVKYCGASVLKPKWFTPPKALYDLKTFDDPEEIVQAFPNDDIQQQIEDCMPDAGGNPEDMQAWITSADFVSQLKRAFMERHKSYQRATVHYSLLQEHLADPTGAIQMGIRGTVEDFDKRSKTGT